MTLYHNAPSASYRSHLFDAEAVEDAGGDPSDETRTPVRSACGHSRSYGPFEPVESDTTFDDLCGKCRSYRLGDEPAESGANNTEAT